MIWLFAIFFVAPLAQSPCNYSAWGEPSSCYFDLQKRCVTESDRSVLAGDARCNDVILITACAPGACDAIPAEKVATIEAAMDNIITLTAKDVAFDVDSGSTTLSAILSSIAAAGDGVAALAAAKVYTDQLRSDTVATASAAAAAAKGYTDAAISNEVIARSTQVAALLTQLASLNNELAGKIGNVNLSAADAKTVLAQMSKDFAALQSQLALKAGAADVTAAVTVASDALELRASNCLAQGLYYDANLKACAAHPVVMGTIATYPACTPSVVGKMVFHSTYKQLILCDGSVWHIVSVDSRAGSASGVAINCSSHKAANNAATSGKYFLGTSQGVIQVFCDMSTTPPISMGGDGGTQATAAASCSFLQANWFPGLNLGDNIYWIDPDGNAINTSNAVRQSCSSTGADASSAGSSCTHIKAQYPASATGPYFITLGGRFPAFKVWCDMDVDGGGWMLSSTQLPDGNLRASGDKAYVAGPASPVNQIYSQAVYNAFAAMGEFQVFVEENSGPDRDTGAVMMYKLPANVPQNYLSNMPIAQFQWWTGAGYGTVNNNAGASVNWLDLSCHSSDFNSISSPQRCVKKSSFSGFANNGDYKMDHAGVHSGTTRCVHGTTGIGVAHYVRLCSPKLGVAC